MKKILSLSVLFAALFLLSGCIKIDAAVTFDKGKMVSGVTLHASDEFIALDEGMKEAANEKKVKDLTSEERLKVCTLLSESSELGGDDEKLSTSEKGIDEKGRLICTTTSEPKVIDNSSLPYTVTYDKENSSYKITGNTEKFLGNDGSTDSEQLKAMDVEASVTFNFVGHVTGYTFNGKNELPAGVSLVEDTGVKFNLLEVSPTDFTIKGSDLKPQDASYLTYILIALGAVAVIGVGAFFLVRSKKFSNQISQPKVPLDDEKIEEVEEL